MHCGLPVAPPSVIPLGCFTFHQSVLFFLTNQPVLGFYQGFFYKPFNFAFACSNLFSRVVESNFWHCKKILASSLCERDLCLHRTMISNAKLYLKLQMLEICQL